ncbi:hypothetical protein [Bradyrhizobium icense]|uniref:Uncharacterized protein n=1 Tax=Bradyrhizobium icense TaxID=1274631 RepID=A0A1B1UC06_9BRAD|nr:hypothetical protein [Bradyrhizobium icense]ANW00302.1 hypothetical protein LMTR13_09100 [Bradyrhizobium icense]
MKRRRGTLVRDIEQNQARIAALRNEQVRISEEIEELTLANKANVMTLVGNAVERLDFGSVAIGDFLALISKMSETGVNDSASAVSSIGPGTIQTFVRLSRNASVANRKALDAARLRWNGRSGGWTGLVSSAQLAELRNTFGDRVQTPEEGGKGQDLQARLDGAQRGVSGGVEAIAELVSEAHGKTDEEVASPTSGATLIPRLPFGAFPVRRSLT